MSGEKKNGMLRLFHNNLDMRNMPENATCPNFSYSQSLQNYLCCKTTGLISSTEDLIKFFFKSGVPCKLDRPSKAEIANNFESSLIPKAPTSCYFWLAFCYKGPLSTDFVIWNDIQRITLRFSSLHWIVYRPSKQSMSKVLLSFPDLQTHFSMTINLVSTVKPQSLFLFSKNYCIQNATLWSLNCSSDRQERSKATITIDISRFWRALSFETFSLLSPLFIMISIDKLKVLN